MLKHRMLTAIILIPLVLLALFLLPQFIFAIVVGLILALAAYEWSRLCGWSQLWQQIIYIAIVLAGCVAAQWGGLFPPILLLSLSWWLMALALLLRYRDRTTLIKLGRITRSFIGILIFISCWIGLVILRSHPMGSIYVLLLLLIVWSMDTGAYFIGKRWGKRKLAPSISPSKTYEGLLGGVVLSFIVALIAAMILQVSWTQWWLWLLIVFATGLVSVVGDLFESLIKRQVGVKDSGNLLPGHGGLLDRIDSLLAAAPIFALAIQWTGF